MQRRVSNGASKRGSGRAIYLNRVKSRGSCQAVTGAPPCWLSAVFGRQAGDWMKWLVASDKQEESSRAVEKVMVSIPESQRHRERARKSISIFVSPRRFSLLAARHSSLATSSSLVAGQPIDSRVVGSQVAQPKKQRADEFKGLTDHVSGKRRNHFSGFLHGD